MPIVFFRTQEHTLLSCLKRLENQYGIIGVHDFNNDTSDEEARGNYAAKHPRSISLECTELEQCEETGDYCFTLRVTQEQFDSLPKNDTPNFTCEKLKPGFVRPTYKVKDYDQDGVWLGTYSDRGVCGFGGTPASIPSEV